MPRRVEKSPFERAAEEGLVGTSTPTSIQRKPNAPKDGEWIDDFLSAVMQGSSVTEAAQIAGVDVTLPYKRRKTDELFKESWREAAEIGTELLEQEAQRRAYHGTLKPVFHKGIQCGFVREYSDTMMIFLLKARRPEVYREGIEDGAGRAPTVININVETVAAHPGEGTGLEMLDAVEAIKLVEVPLNGVAGDKQNHQGPPEAAPVS